MKPHIFSVLIVMIFSLLLIGIVDAKDSFPNDLKDAQVLQTTNGTTSRVSVASDGTQGNGHSDGASISADGRYVAFLSYYASNLVPSDTNGAGDVFVHDRQTGQTSRVSVASDGTQGNGNSWSPSISADGRYVAFHSDASNLVLGDTNGRGDVFVHDRQTEQTSRVSVASDGTQGNDTSSHSSISADGRYVFFRSLARNLVPSDTNNAVDIFVHDRQTGQTSRVSVTSSGTQGNGHSESPSISADGRYLVFWSEASNLIPDDTNSKRDVFVHDWQTGQTSRISVASDGTQANSDSVEPSISADGRYVAFSSNASNLVPSDTNGAGDIFVYDRQTDQTSRVSVASDGTQGNRLSQHPIISADGRYVAFISSSNNLVPGDTNSINSLDVFVHDRQTEQTSRVSVASDGTQTNGSASSTASISANGRYVAFSFSASNLVPGDTNNARDIFVHDRGAVNLTYFISGQVTDENSNPITGVSVSATGSDNATTDGDGHYTITGLTAGNYSLLADKDGYTFTPALRTVTLPPNASGVDFVGSKTVTTPECDDLKDTDGDALPDGWEVCGYFSADNNTDYPDVDLPAMGADWRHKDVFLEIDYMNGGLFRNFKPDDEAVRIMVDAFNNAPVSNDDGTTGIHLHVDYGSDAPLTYGAAAKWKELSQSEELDHEDGIVVVVSHEPLTTDWTKYAEVMQISKQREHVFHYQLDTDWIESTKFLKGISNGAPGQFTAVSRSVEFLPLFITRPVNKVAGVSMHELGHGLGLHHGGEDDRQYKPNYLSIMNYSFTEGGLIIDKNNGNYNFSIFNDIDPLVEYDLNEFDGVTSSSGEDINSHTTIFYDGHPPPEDPDDDNRHEGLIGGPIDWNNNGGTPEDSVGASINYNDNYLEVLESSNDWENLVFDGGEGTGCIGTVGPCNYNTNSANMAVSGFGSVILDATDGAFPDFDLPYEISMSMNYDYEVPAGTDLQETVPVTIINTGTEVSTVDITYQTNSTVFDLNGLPSVLVLQPDEEYVWDVSFNTAGTTVDHEELVVNAVVRENTNWTGETHIELIEGEPVDTIAYIHLPVIISP